jgi:hypothetical protein
MIGPVRELMVFIIVFLPMKELPKYCRYRTMPLLCALQWVFAIMICPHGMVILLVEIAFHGHCATNYMLYCCERNDTMWEIVIPSVSEWLRRILESRNYGHRAGNESCFSSLHHQPRLLSK